jgi:hypothetical protein
MTSSGPRLALVKVDADDDNQAVEPVESGTLHSKNLVEALEPGLTLAQTWLLGAVLQQTSLEEAHEVSSDNQQLAVMMR